MIVAVHIARGSAVLALALASCSSADSANDPASSAPRPPATPTDTPPDPSSLSIDLSLQQSLDDWFGAGEIGGAVAAIGLPDGSVRVATIGDGAPGKPAGRSDTMRIGSITKTFMAALVLRLDDLGVLDIDERVAAHLPDLDIDDTVTIRNLLAHTSGISDPDPEELIALFRADSSQRFEYEDLIAFADIPTLEAEPSDEFAYANAGYHLLGGVVEAATGTDVATALRTHVFEPGGLTETYLAGAEPVPTEIVPGNVDLDGDGREDSLVDVPYLAVETAMWTAGAVVTTPDDLIGFARALFDGSIISDHALAEMTNTSNAEHGHGLGIFDLAIDDKTAYGNSGGAPGFHANLAHDPDRRITALVFTNCPACPVSGLDTWQLLVDLLAIAEANTS